MTDLTDQQLLRDFAARQTEAAFSELVRRHVDLVYSAALRMVCDADLARDVTQGVFLALAQTAKHLIDHPVLSGWLHRTARNLAAKAVRGEVRRRAREQEAAAMNELISAGSDARWDHLAPHLDNALAELSEPDRDALLLRYFERKSAREMAQTLGISDEAAQKRVNRAVERLREVFAERGLTVGAGGLAAVLSANAVQAAPAGLAVAISTAAALAATAITGAASASATATQTIAMITLQKTLLTVALAVLVGTSLYEAREAARLRTRIQTLDQQQELLAGQVNQLRGERDQATGELAAIQDRTDQANRNTSDLLRLRGLVSSLQNRLTLATNAPPAPANPSPSAPAHPAWKLREPRKLEEFQNVGNETPEATAETLLWAAQNNSTNLLGMVYLPTEMLTKASAEGSLDVLPRALGFKILLGASAVKGEDGQVWLDGGRQTTILPGSGDATNTYAGVVSFNLTGGQMGDPAKERSTDMYFARVDGAWKLVVPGMSPQIPGK